MRHGRDEADAAAGFLDVEIARRATGLVVGVLQRPTLAQAAAHHRQRQVLGRAVAVDITHRHGLDQAEIEAMFAAPFDHPVELVLVHILHGDSIDLDRQASGLGGEDAVQRLLDLAPAGDAGEGFRVQRVERHVDPPHPRRIKSLGVLGELGAVGGDSELAEPTLADSRAEALEQPHHIAAHQRLAAGDAYLGGPQANEGGAEPIQLFQAQNVLLRQEGHVLGHAIDAAKVTAVGNGHAEIGDATAKRIDHGLIGLQTQVRCAASGPWLQVHPAKQPIPR